MPRRVFIAIPIPNDVRIRMDAEVAAFEPEMPRGVRIVDRENWHITMLFMGEREGDEAEKIRGTLAQLALSLPAPRIVFRAFVYGPSRVSPPRMIWCVTDDTVSKELGALREKILGALSAAAVAVPAAHGAFLGHVTIARIREGIRNLPPLNIPFAESFTAETLVLFESRLDHSGATYTVLEEWQLHV